MIRNANRCVLRVNRHRLLDLFLAVGVFFVFPRLIMVAYTNKDKSIMCPRCKNLLTKADKRDCTVHKLACRKCGKWIWFVPATDEFEIKEVPPRTTASGMRFY